MPVTTSAKKLVAPGAIPENGERSTAHRDT
jgi:hypothetical protein